MLWAAYRLSKSVWLNSSIRVAVIFCVLTSAIYYVDGLPRSQDGEFGIVFFLAIPQSLLAFTCLAISLWIRRACSGI